MIEHRYLTSADQRVLDWEKASNGTGHDSFNSAAVLKADSVYGVAGTDKQNMSHIFYFP